MAALDDSQRAAVSAGIGDACVRILGGPGTGKSTVAMEIVAERIARHGQAAARLVTPSRTAATRLRDILGLRVGIATTGPLVRSVSALAFDLVSRFEISRDRPRVTRLMSGGQQDSDIEELLVGEMRDGDDGYWPSALNRDVRSLREFRTQLRDLLARVRDAGYLDTNNKEPFHRLAELGTEQNRPEWVAAARFLTSYRKMMASSRSAQFDPSELLHRATAIVADGSLPVEEADRFALVVDDAQDLTPSQWAFLEAWSLFRAPVIALGDPDLGTTSFRGGRSRQLTVDATFAWAETLHLLTNHRQSGSVPGLLGLIAAQIGGGDAEIRQSYPTPLSPEESRADGSFELLSAAATSPAHEREVIARFVRDASRRGTPLDRIAVVARSGSLVESLVAHLTASSVPAYAETTGMPLRDHPVVWSILTLVDIGLGRSRFTPRIARDLLLGPFGRLTVLDYRRFRRALRRVEIAAEPEHARLADDLVIEALDNPSVLATTLDTVPDGVRFIADVVADVRQAAAKKPAPSIDELLWLVWNRSNRADDWAAASRGTGPVASAAHESLDAVLALFSVAATALDNNPSESASVFVARMLEQTVPNDSLTPRATTGSVLVCTPAATVGREFDVVVVAGLNEGVWPNTRVRSALLHAPEFSDRADASFAPTNDARKEIVFDEARLFLVAASRATERLLVTAVSSEDETPSGFFRLIAGEKDVDGLRGAKERSGPEVPALNARGRVFRAERIDATIGELVGRLRHELVFGTGDDKERAAAALRELTRREVRGAAPHEWIGFDRHEAIPLFADSTIAIAPSGIHSFTQSALDWFVSNVAGGSRGIEAGIGTLVHWVIENLPTGNADDMWALADERFAELDFAAPWQAAQWRARVRAMVTALAAYVLDASADGRTVALTEEYLRVTVRESDGDVPAITVGGKIDRIESAADGSYLVLDLKTSSKAASNAETQRHPQLSAYQVMFALAALGPAFDSARRLRSAGLLYPSVPDKDVLYTLREQSGFDEASRDEFLATLIDIGNRMNVARFDGDAKPPQRGPDPDPEAQWVRIPEVSSHG